MNTFIAPLACASLALAAVSAVHSQPPRQDSNQERTQIRFTEPAGMQVRWLTQENGKSVFTSVALEVPGRFNFRQGAVYQLKLTHIPGHPGLELYPTLEVPRSAARAGELLAHVAVPLALTADDLERIVKGELLTKAVYAPGAPRGQALVVLRCGNIDRQPR